MARKKKHEEHVNHERWVISYADFVTLLFAFFVVMFAVSQVDSKKLGRFTQSFNAATQWEVMQSHGRGGNGLLPGEPPESTAPSANLPDLPPTAEGEAAARGALKDMLSQRLKTQANLEGLTIEDLHGELVLRLPEHLLFDNAQASLRVQGRAALDAVVDTLQDRAVRIRIEGHTDSVPIRTPQFPSNWELSTARATACVRYVLETNRIAPDRLAAAGYGQHHPVAGNDTPEGRARNRRVDIVITIDEPDRDAKRDAPSPREPAALDPKLAAPKETSP